MRIAVPALCLFIVLFTACQREIDFQDPSDRTTQEAGLPRLITYVNYDSTGLVEYDGYLKVSMDSAQKTITFLYDSLFNHYLKYYYDDNGRLTKVISKDTAAALDSLYFTRNGNQVNWTTSYSSHRATITALPNNQKQVYVEPLTSSYQENYYTIELNSTNLITTIRDSAIAIAGPWVSQPRVSSFYYNSQNSLDSLVIRDTATMGAQMFLQIHKLSYTRDNQSSQYWINFIEKLWGPDLQWLSAVDHSGWFQKFFPANFSASDKQFLFGGSILTENWSLTDIQKAGGVSTVQTRPVSSDVNTIEYDNLGRVKKITRKSNNRLSLVMQISYS